MDKQNETNCYAYFTITSELPLTAIESHMGLIGEDRSWNKGDPRKPTGAGRYSFSRWSLQSNVDAGRSLDEHLQSIWNRITEYRSQIRELPSSMNGFLQCTGFFETHRDHFSLSAGHFKTLAYYGLKLDCDFYFMDDFGNEDDGQPSWVWQQ